ncbi:transaldolase/EF-hand domain-containing protein [Gimesia panareensis]|uniref:Transaldolase/EF-hand domain-containing protein n=1 Tax=Gimesia panareensis TaxID=2527978 RepID=A0A518FIJ4_9PLAN|nr:EF-hand domain-containing protein [Gimesia panareensis]QDV16171.1 transaldolase/EF-hand domain-containing protein [Gimesia panareensis]
MQRISPVLALVTLFGFSTVSSFAAPDEETSSKEKVFQQLDKNSDGTITADEVPDEKSRFFEFLLRSGDQNKDGKLTKGEFEGGLKKEDQKFEAGDERRGNQGPRFYNRFLSRLDRNGDKKISKDELPEPLRERMEPLFQRLNTDEISLEQLERMGNMFGNRRPPRPEGPGMNSPERAERFFKSLDTNQDGKLTLDEAPERARFMLNRIFERSGKEADATLTKEEFMKAMAAFRTPQRPGRRDADRGKKPEAENGEMKRPEMQAPDMSRTRFGNSFPRSGALFLRTVDQNGDGKLSREELQQINRWFDEVDRNRDGFLDQSEIAGQPRPQRRYNPTSVKRPGRPALDQPKDDSKQKASE